ncbi:MAG: HEAT repeat domain-containing protein, partial [Longimicrobiales bacterium]
MRKTMFFVIALSMVAAGEASARQVPPARWYPRDHAAELEARLRDMNLQLEHLRSAATVQSRIEADVLRRQMELMHAQHGIDAERLTAQHRLETEMMAAAVRGGFRPARAWPAWPQIEELNEPQDPADSLYRQGRRLLNRSDYREAASLFRLIRTEQRFNASAYRPSSYFYEAFALARTGESDELRQARELLSELKTQYPRDRLIRDAETLDVTIAGRLARTGDVAAAADVERRATSGQQCPSDEEDIRVTALNALIHMDAANAVPILREVMAKRDACSAHLRRQAIFLLSQKRGSGIDQILLDAVRNDPDPEVREAAVHWLSQVETPEAVAALEDILRTSTDADVQSRAIFALSQNRSDRAAQVLRDFASRADTPPELRRNAIVFIGQRRGSNTIEFLRSLYSQVQDPQLKEIIIHSISQVRDAQSAEWLINIALSDAESSENRQRALFFAAQQGTIPIARIGQLYDTARDNDMKQHVLHALSQRLNDPAAVEKLMDIGRKESDPDLRR